MSSQQLTKTTERPTTSTLVSHTRNGQPLYKSNIPTPAPQQILEEDEYTEALSKIIERDFFPDLAKLKRQHAYLEAVEMNDLERIAATARDLAGNDTPLGQRRLRTPAQTPKLNRTGLPNEAWTPARVDAGLAAPTWKDDPSSTTPSLGAAETPMLDTPSGSTLRKTRKATDTEKDEMAIDTSLSLDQFQARYTSEDNASFNEIVEKLNERRKEKYRWIYDQERKSMRLIEQGRDPDQKLLTQGDTGQDNAAEDLTGEGGKKLQLMLSDKRSGTIPTWGYKAKNSLMYFPEGLGTHLQEEMIRGNPKEIVHSNTNFQGQDLLVVNQSAAAKFDPTPFLQSGVTDSPKVNGFGFVSSTPSPSVSTMGDDPAMMTWGTVEDEPLLISSGVEATGASPFKLPATPRRELIAQKLSEKASKSFRESSSLRAQVFSSPSASAVAKYHASLGNSTPTPRFNAPYSAVSPSPYRRSANGSSSRSRSNHMASPNPRVRADMLSPAARSLLSRARSSSSRGADQQLRSSYGSGSGDRHGSVTPSPLSTSRK